MERVRDYSSDEMEMLRIQQQAGIHLFPEMESHHEGTAIDAFLADHSNACLSTETVNGFPLIIDETRKDLSETVGHTGVAYPIFDHPYSDIPSGYAFHAVHSATQKPHPLAESSDI
jgi:hypothetical protein